MHGEPSGIGQGLDPGPPFGQVVGLEDAVARAHLVKGYGLDGVVGQGVGVVDGDAAMDLALNAIAYGRKQTGNTSIRPHLIHCQYVRPDQFDRIAEMGNIGMTFFTTHVYYWGDAHRDLLLGPERAPQIAAMKSAVDRGIPYAMHNAPRCPRRIRWRTCGSPLNA